MIHRIVWTKGQQKQVIKTIRAAGQSQSDPGVTPEWPRGAQCKPVERRKTLTDPWLTFEQCKFYPRVTPDMTWGWPRSDPDVTWGWPWTDATGWTNKILITSHPDRSVISANYRKRWDSHSVRREEGKWGKCTPLSSRQSAEYHGGRKGRS